MFAYVLLCVSSTVVRDTLGPYRFWPGRSGWSDGEAFVANSCYKLGRYCEICTASFWNGCESGKLWRAFAASQQSVVSLVCQGGVQSAKSVQRDWQRCENVCKQGFEHMRHSVACASFWKNAETTILEVTLSWLSSSKSGLSDLLQQSLQNLFDNILDMFWHVYFFSRSWQACPAFDHVLACLFFQTHLPGMC